MKKPTHPRRLSLLTLASFFLLETAALANPTARQPIVKGELSSLVESRLKEAFPIARQRLREHPTCGQLFEPFGKDGTAALAVTRYLPATLVQENRHCRRASALTGVRSPVTRLCRSFARLPNEIAAQVLIHEALHYAGMTESPSDPTALDSASINQLVAKSCRQRLTRGAKIMRRP